MKLHLLLTAALLTGAAADEAPDRCLAPYFEIEGTGETETSAASFPLRHTEANVTISGVIAEVTVRQIYANTGSGTIEATYLFPASTRAAVHGMEMKIGERRVVAKIQEKVKAKQTYEKAKAENKSAALLEQHRPNVFQMSVANILPGDEVAVTLRYSEILRPDAGIYEFVYPTVVGPRHSSKSPGGGDEEEHQWVANPYLAEGAQPAAAPGFDFNFQLNAGMPIQSLKCASHDVQIDYQGKDSALVSMNGADIANRDIIVRYRLADEKIVSGLLLHQDDRENFFLLNVQPPERVRPEHIPPREYLFVIDISGSMAGFPLNLAKDLFRDLIGGLREEDSFNILAFAGSSAVMANKPVPATKANIARGITFIDQRNGGGGTELVHALRKAIELPGSEENSRSIIVITDGLISMEADAFELVQQNLGRANLFAFGIGSSVNRHLIEGLARLGMGEPFVVTEPSEAQPVAKKLRDYISSPVLTNIHIEGDGIELRETEPGGLPDVFASRPLTLTGKWKGEPSGTVRVSGTTGGGGTFTQEFDFAEAAKTGLSNPPLRALWARERIRSLADYARIAKDDEKAKEVTSLGLTYSLATPWTSFVAVDEMVRGVKSPATLVKQPLPLPQGVSNSAVGGGALVSTGSVPEPGATLLVLISLLTLTFIRNR